jgi:hypothetical protein
MVLPGKSQLHAALNRALALEAPVAISGNQQFFTVASPFVFAVRIQKTSRDALLHNAAVRLPLLSNSVHR